MSPHLGGAESGEEEISKLRGVEVSVVVENLEDDNVPGGKRACQTQ
jgi:hypothetical protein